MRNPFKRQPRPAEKPSLRERAAALKATAARLIRKPKNGPNADARNPVQAAAGADPRLVAMVAEWQDVRRKLNDPATLDGPEADALADAHSLRQGEIYLYPARSVLDLLAKVPVLGDELAAATRDYDNDGMPKDLAHAAWTGLLADIKRIAGHALAASANNLPDSAVVDPDPIFTAIEASRAAQTAVETWSTAADAGTGKPTAAHFEEEDHLVAEQSHARERVLATVPTTPAGRLALLEFLRWQMGLYSYTDGTPPDAGSPFWRDAYKALKAALAYEPPAPIASPEAGADADLCALAGPWEAACRLYDRTIEEQSALERAAELHPSYPGERSEGTAPMWDEFHQRWLEYRDQSGIAASEEASGNACLALGEIEDRIAALPARTLVGLQIKARVAERNSSIDVEWPQGLGDGLVQDLLALTSDAATQPERDLGREAFHYARGLDVSDVSFENLWRLYEVFSGVYEHLSAGQGEAMFNLAKPGQWRHPTPGGTILDAEINRFGCLRDVFVRELERRSPRDVSERDARLEILVRHEMQCEGGIRDKDLLAEINAAWGA